MNGNRRLTVKNYIYFMNENAAQDFVKRYSELCNELKHRFVVKPVWIARDDGTFSMQLQTSVSKFTDDVESTQKNITQQ